MKTARFTCSGALRGCSGLLLPLGLLLGASSLIASESTPALSSDVTQTVWLERHDVNVLVRWGATIAPQPQPFVKEPQLGTRGVSRGTLRLAGVSDAPTAFIWDRTQGKLYLDLNQNRDLTDDVPSGFVCSDRGEYAQTFTNIYLPLKPGGTPAIPVTVSLYNAGSGNVPNGIIGLSSFWASKLTLGGRDFEIGYIPEMAGRNSYLVLRPWEERQQSFTLSDGSLTESDFCPNLFVGTNGYRLECSPEQPDGILKYKLTVREKPVELGALKLEGQFIRRLVLTGNPDRLPNGRFTVLLDSPGPVVKVPAGTYGEIQAMLERGGVQACRQLMYVVTPPAVTISSEPGKVATLKIGGPLTNTVSVGRRGSFLTLNYRLAGADGFNYRLVSTGEAKAPRLSITKNGKVIHADNFQFG